MVELLAPAGSMDALKAAIAGGANAIYVGGNRFNARAYATNFNIDELKEAVQLCHKHNVSLFVTVNTLYKDCEIESLYEYLCDLYRIQVDALIVQDLGIMKLIQDHFVDFEVHASTQCSIHNKEGVKHLQNYGVKRVVVARENTLEEIKDMVSTGVEIEAFIHGALCVSYSGQCMMSQLIGKRSANRGMCAQPCRLPYKLYKDDKIISDTSYLMSCKDLCTIENIDQLIDAGVTSFKIEGRMKRPEYVYAITKAYRNAIDHKGQADINVLKQMFNRDFTKGYIFSDKQVVSSVFSGNRGIPVGKVVSYDQKNKRLKIKASTTIHQGDGIRIGYSDEGKVLNKLYFNNKLINQIEEQQVFDIDYDRFVKRDTLIYRTTDFNLEKETAKELSSTIRKHDISMCFEASVGNYAKLTISDGNYHVSVMSDELLEKAIKEVDADRIKTQLTKLGNTIYTCKDIVVDIKDDCYIPITVLNELRRKACDQLDQCRQNRKVRLENIIKPLSLPKIKEKESSHSYIHCHSYEQLKSILPLQNNEMIYLDYCDNFIDIKNEFSEIGLVIPTICNESLFNKIDEIIKQFPNLSVAINNVGAFERYQNNVTLLLPGLNLSHYYSHQLYKQPAVLSLDMDLADEKNLLKHNPNIVIMTYGHIDAMTTKHCPVSYQKFNQKNEKCNLCLQGKYCLSDRMNAKFPLLFDHHCIVRVLSDKALKRKPMNHQYLRFTIESPTEIQELLRKYRNN